MGAMDDGFDYEEELDDGPKTVAPALTLLCRFKKCRNL